MRFAPTEQRRILKLPLVVYLTRQKLEFSKGFLIVDSVPLIDRLRFVHARLDANILNYSDTTPK